MFFKVKQKHANKRHADVKTANNTNLCRM